MYQQMKIGAVIPARDEELNIATVVSDLKALKVFEDVPLIDDIVVCDNGSQDRTASLAVEAGARVVQQNQPGYGIACLTAIDALQPVDVVLFVDGDQSFELHESIELFKTIADGADLAIGSRVLGNAETGSLSLPQRVGNRVAAILIGLLWRQRVTDLGPFRAIRTQTLQDINMQDQAYGWTVEMQIKAIKHNHRVKEIPIATKRRRHGKSKVGGTLKGVIGASIGILTMILKLALEPN